MFVLVSGVSRTSRNIRSPRTRLSGHVRGGVRTAGDDLGSRSPGSRVGYSLSRFTVQLMLIILAVGFVNRMGHTANWCHLFGLIIGACGASSLLASPLPATNSDASTQRPPSDVLPRIDRPAGGSRAFGAGCSFVAPMVRVVWGVAGGSSPRPPVRDTIGDEAGPRQHRKPCSRLWATRVRGRTRAEVALRSK